MSEPERDLVGYGANRPTTGFPDGKRLAISLVVNYEEGSERSFAMGDPDQETLTEWGQYPFPPDIRNLAMETMHEYGSRVGVWRILDIFERHDVKSTFFACAVAFEHDPGRRARGGGARARDLQPRLPVGGSLPPERGRGARAHPTRGRVVRACVRKAARGLVLPLWTEHADAQAPRRGRRVHLRLRLVQRRGPALHGGRGPSAPGRALHARCERHRVLAGQRHGHGRAVRDLPARFVRRAVRRVRALSTDDVDRAALPSDRTAGPLALARPVHRVRKGVRRRLVRHA